MIQLACETDFVAKTDKFQEGLTGILNTLHDESNFGNSKGDDKDFMAEFCKSTQMVESLDPDANTQTIEDAIKYLISKTQENCQLTKVFQKEWNPSQG